MADSRNPSVSLREIDDSCRIPVGFLLLSAGGWLVLASLAALFAGLRFHSPAMWAACPYVSYGRLQPFATNLFLYGFLIQAGLAVLLWLAARLAISPVVSGGAAVAGGLIWNLGVALGGFGILIGDSTSFELLEFPRYASVPLLVAYIGVAVAILKTFAARRTEELFPSEWFLLAAVFWFPWVYSTASLLLHFHPVRGALAPAIAWWYGGNIQIVWVSCVALAAVFYLVPMTLSRALFSRYYAIFSLWFLLIFGSLTGIPQGVPLPSWMPALSAVASILLVLPAIAAGLNVQATVRGATGKGGRVLFLSVFAITAFVAFACIKAATSTGRVAEIVHATWFNVGLSRLQLYGFGALAIFAAAFHLLPGVLGKPCEKLAKLQVGTCVAGLLLQVVSLLCAGWLQGHALNHPSGSFLDAQASGMMAFRLSTLGDLLLVVGHIAFYLNLKLLAWDQLKQAAYGFAGLPLRPVGVKS